jgi:hypothetical protein
LPDRGDELASVLVDARRRRGHLLVSCRAVAGAKVRFLRGDDRRQQ